MRLQPIKNDSVGHRCDFFFIYCILRAKWFTQRFTECKAIGVGMHICLTYSFSFVRHAFGRRILVWTMKMTATMGSVKTMVSQRYSLKSQINHTQISNDMQNVVWNSLSCYVIFVWFDDIFAWYALGNKLYVIRTCPSLFLQTLKSLYLYAFVGYFFLFHSFCFTYIIHTDCEAFKLESIQ